MDPADTQQEQPIPKGQALFDNIFLWAVLSIALSVLLYNVWGLVDLMSVPLAP